MIEVQKNTIGTCTWTLIDGVLTVESDNNKNGVLKSFTDTGFRCDRPFNVDDVKCVVIKHGVSAANDISDLFRDFSLCERMIPP